MKKIIRAIANIYMVLFGPILIFVLYIAYVDLKSDLANNNKNDPDLLSIYSKEICKSFKGQYVDAIPIELWETNHDSTYQSYYFLPIGSRQMYFADIVINSKYDTSFVMIFKDSINRPWTAIVKQKK